MPIQFGLTSINPVISVLESLASVSSSFRAQRTWMYFTYTHVKVADVVGILINRYQFSKLASKDFRKKGSNDGRCIPVLTGCF